MEIPTWITNTLFLVTLIMTANQYRRINPRHSILNERFVLPIFCGVLVLVTALYNHSGPWVSVGFFAASVLFLFRSIYLVRIMPPEN
jgi:hypothetical protein